MAELEGFICPLCRKDLKGISQLEEHFKDEHEEKRFSKFKSNLKTIFDKAKPKIMKKRELSVDEGATAAVATLAFFDPAAIVSGIDPALWPPQEFGTCLCVFCPQVCISSTMLQAPPLTTCATSGRLGTPNWRERPWQRTD